MLSACPVCLQYSSEQDNGQWELSWCPIKQSGSEKCSVLFFFLNVRRFLPLLRNMPLEYPEMW